MRICRYRDGDEARLGRVLDDGSVVPLDGQATTVDDLVRDPALAEIMELAVAADGRERLPAPALLAPLLRPSKIVAIGRNYREHAAEEGVDVPAAPLMFAKFPSSIVGPGDEIRWSARLTDSVDFEAELAVVIGTAARDVPMESALQHVFGYTCLNDVSARDLQFGDGQWIRGKSLDTFCPVGPVVVTADEIVDPQALGIRCRVNGDLLQDASTSQMYFTVAELISYCSRNFTLEPGDLIATGTPSGVGVFRDPPVYLRDGDVVRVEIDGIGTLSNPCRVLQALDSR